MEPLASGTAPVLGSQAFDGFPYLITRIEPGLYHVIVLPPWRSAAQYQHLLGCQVEANRLEACLVLGPQSAWYATPDGRPAAAARPPTGGIIVTDRLEPPEAFEPTPDLLARRARLGRFAAARNPGGYLTGDLTKGGRPATAGERVALEGSQPNGVPKGLERCWWCRDWRGVCLDPSPNFPGQIMRAHCRCENHNRCARCGRQLAERRLNANFFDERDGQIWHVPGYCGLRHRC